MDKVIEYLKNHKIVYTCDISPVIQLDKLGLSIARNDSKIILGMYCQNLINVIFLGEECLYGDYVERFTEISRISKAINMMVIGTKSHRNALKIIERNVKKISEKLAKVKFDSDKNNGSFDRFNFCLCTEEKYPNIINFRNNEKTCRIFPYSSSSEYQGFEAEYVSYGEFYARNYSIFIRNIYFYNKYASYFLDFVKSSNKYTFIGDGKATKITIQYEKNSNHSSSECFRNGFLIIKKGENFAIDLDNNSISPMGSGDISFKFNKKLNYILKNSGYSNEEINSLAFLSEVSCK